MSILDSDRLQNIEDKMLMSNFVNNEISYFSRTSRTYTLTNGYLITDDLNVKEMLSEKSQQHVVNAIEKETGICFVDLWKQFIQNYIDPDWLGGMRREYAIWFQENHVGIGELARSRTESEIQNPDSIGMQKHYTTLSKSFIVKYMEGLGLAKLTKDEFLQMNHLGKVNSTEVDRLLTVKMAELPFYRTQFNPDGLYYKVSNKDYLFIDAKEMNILFVLVKYNKEPLGDVGLYKDYRVSLSIMPKAEFSNQKDTK